MSNILLILLLYIIQPTKSTPNYPTITEHTIDIHIPIAIPLEDFHIKPKIINQNYVLTTTESPIEDQYSSNSDNNYQVNYEAKNEQVKTVSKNEIRVHEETDEGHKQKETAKSIHDKSKMDFINKQFESKRIKNKFKTNKNVIPYGQPKPVYFQPVTEAYYYKRKFKYFTEDNEKVNDKVNEAKEKHIIYYNNTHQNNKQKKDNLQEHRDVKKQNIKDVIDQKEATGEAMDNENSVKTNGTTYKQESFKNKNIINVLHTRKVRKPKHNIHNHEAEVKQNSDEIIYPEQSPVYLPEKDNVTKSITEKKNNETIINGKLYYPITTANYYDMNDENYSLPGPKLESRNRKANSKPRNETVGGNTFKNTESTGNTSFSISYTINKGQHINKQSTDAQNRSSITNRINNAVSVDVEPYNPVLLRYEKHPENLHKFRYGSFAVSQNSPYQNAQQNLNRKRQSEFDKLLENDAKQQTDEAYGSKVKKHGKRGFKLISDFINLVTGNHPPKRYHHRPPHIIGSDGYVFEGGLNSKAFESGLISSNNEALALSHQGLSLSSNNPFEFSNGNIGNSNNFNINDLENNKIFSHSLSIDPNTGNQALGLNSISSFSGSGNVGSQKINFGTSANGETFAFSNNENLKSQVENIYNTGKEHSGASENVRIVTKEVPVPYPVQVEKRVPFFIRVPHDRAVPIPIHKPYPVHITKPVPYPVKVHVPAPYPVTVEKHVPYPVKVSVPKPVAIHIPKPFPVYIEKKVPITVERPVPYPVKVPYEKPVPVHIAIEKPVPYPVTKHVPYPIRIPVEKPYPLTIPKPYPVTVEKHVPVKVPYKLKVPVPISINFPGKNEQWSTGEGQNTVPGTTSFGSFDESGGQSNGAPNFPENFYNQESGGNGYDSGDANHYPENTQGSFDYSDPGTADFNNENVQSNFGENNNFPNTGAGFDSGNLDATAFSTNGQSGSSNQALIPDINTVKVPEVNQNYQIYFDGNRNHKHKQTQDIFNEVNTVFDNLEQKATIPNFDQVGGTAQSSPSQFPNSFGRSVKYNSGQTRFGRNSQETKPLSGTYRTQSSSFRSNEFKNQNQQSSEHAIFPGSQEYNKIDYTMLGESFENSHSQSRESSLSGNRSG